MPKIVQGLIWGAAMMMVALAESFGVLAKGVTSILILVIPLVAVLSISGRRPCRRGEA